MELNRSTSQVTQQVKAKDQNKNKNKEKKRNLTWLELDSGSNLTRATIKLLLMLTKTNSMLFQSSLLTFLYCNSLASF